MNDDRVSPDLAGPVHLLGALGAGQSGLARLLVARGLTVTGHDRGSASTRRGLVELGVALTVGEESAAEHLPAGTRCVVRSAAVPLDDPQVLAARARGLPVLKYAEALGRIAPRGRTLAVAGTHGKTTTGWLTLHALRAARPDTGALIGGTCRVLGTGAIAPKADGPLVVEACEFDRSFHQLDPTAAAITNVEPDHLDYFGSFDAIVEAFARFAERVDPAGRLILDGEAPEAIERAARCEVWRLGRELEVVDLGSRAGFYRFGLRSPLGRLDRVELSVPGAFQVGNAVQALALAATACGSLTPDHGRGISEMRGAGRRFESWGEIEGRELVHDYAHHPTELEVTLRTAREVFPGRPLHLLFQPHQYGRTARFLDEFAGLFALCDATYVTDVYGARRPASGEPSASAIDLVARARELGTFAHAAGELRVAGKLFASSLPVNGIGLVVGAGDVESLREPLIDELHRRTVSAG